MLLFFNIRRKCDTGFHHCYTRLSVKGWLKFTQYIYVYNSRERDTHLGECTCLCGRAQDGDGSYRECHSRDWQGFPGDTLRTHWNLKGSCSSPYTKSEEHKGSGIRSKDPTPRRTWHSNLWSSSRIPLLAKRCAPDHFHPRAASARMPAVHLGAREGLPHAVYSCGREDACGRTGREWCPVLPARTSTMANIYQVTIFTSICLSASVLFPVYIITICRKNGFISSMPPRDIPPFSLECMKSRMAIKL